MVERRDTGDNVYTVEPLTGQGGLKTVKRTELLDTKAMALMDVDVFAERHDRPLPEGELRESATSFDEDEHEAGFRIKNAVQEISRPMSSEPNLTAVIVFKYRIGFVPNLKDFVPGTYTTLAS